MNIRLNCTKLLKKIFRVSQCGRQEEKDSTFLPQIENLRKRLKLIRDMQIYGILSLLLCVVSMFFIYIQMYTVAAYIFGIALILLIISLAICVREIQISIRALDVHLHDMEI